MSINSNEYSNSHPYLSVDEETLYFVSDRPNGFGETDIYSVNIIDEDILGTPKNLGAHINTCGRDSFPFISENNELYFASDGYEGLGAYDIYFVDLNLKETSWRPYNLGEPINSSQDDFAFSINNKKKEGYFSSNRQGGMGQDDIYSFKELKLVNENETYITNVFLTDCATQMPLKNAMVKVLEPGTIDISVLKTDENGKFSVSSSFQNLFLEIDYNDNIEEAIAFKNDTNVKSICIEVNKQGQQEEIATAKIEEIKQIQFASIYYDLDKHNIKPEYISRIGDIISYLKENSSSKLEIVSHSDSRGTNSYNLELSNRRALSVYDILIANKIDPDRIEHKGLGESFLLNNCPNNINCKENHHEKNRRTEFIITF